MNLYVNKVNEKGRKMQILTRRTIKNVTLRKGASRNNKM